MANKFLTVFQNLDKAISGNWDANVQNTQQHTNSYNMTSPNILYKTDDKNDYEKTKLELQQNNYLNNRWKKANTDLSVTAFSGLNNVKLMYRDADLMDSFPEIGAALDVISEESCLSGNVEIKLLNGDVKTVKKLFDEQYNNFWVYSVDEEGQTKPSLVEKVQCNGIKELFCLTLDDETKIECTADHKWLLSNNIWKRTDELCENDSMMSIYDKINYLGYEKVKSTIENKFTLTHRIVAEAVLHDYKKYLASINERQQKIIIHHNSFNKLNNDPNYLTYMLWDEHQKLHTDLNTEKWKDEEFSKKMRMIFSETAHKTWKEKGDVIKKKLKKVWEERKKTITKEELIKTFARKGEQNGMFGVHRYGKKNPNYNFSKRHIEDINEEEYINFVLQLKSKYRESLSENFNLTMETVINFNKFLCKKYNIKNITEIKYIFNIEKLKKIVKNGTLNKYNVSKSLSINTQDIDKCVEFNSYKNWDDFTKQCFNHKVIKIEKLNKKDYVYDLINSSCNNSFAVKCNNGHIITHNCVLSPKGQVVNVFSKSDRIKNIIEDLLVNRLDLQILAPMVIRAMCKYGNQFMLLNIDNKLGVTGWRQLPVFEVERIENGIRNPYGSTIGMVNSTDDADLSTKFVWSGEQQSTIPFRNWQIGHFRLLTDSIYLPYGVSFLNKARRHWRMLSLMEDMMLIYRLERSIERRVYKIFVGAIDDADVQAYVEEIANNFKRTPIVDPLTGQVDLRKNLLPVRKDTPIPLLDGRTITIEDLSKEYEEGKINYVYSIQDETKAIVPGKVVWCGKNYTADELVKITLDDGSYTVMAREHEVIMRDGSKKRADELNINESVMPYECIDKIIANIEYISGDDVYCMTVVGDNGEEDRHNFALKTFNEDGSWHENGIFVSNCVDTDIFIPVRDPNASTPIDTLPAAQNLTAMDDIKFIQNKVLTALRIPKTFLNFEETTGDGKNLALMDIRFTRTINRIQQAFLMELTKIVSIHLYLMGFDDELTNFSLSMNNPSTQSEQLEIDNLQKKILAVRDAVTDPGNGIPIMSQTRALREIMKWSDKEIKDNLEEIRLEKGIAAELEKTSQIIKKTGVFDIVDRMYGETGAEYQDDQTSPQDGGDGGMSGGGGGGFGGGLDDMGGIDDDSLDGDVSGEEGEMPTEDLGNEDNGDTTTQPEMKEPSNENKKYKKPLLTEVKQKSSQPHQNDFFIKQYLNHIDKKEKKKDIVERTDIVDKTLLINEDFNNIIKSIDTFLD